MDQTSVRILFPRCTTFRLHFAEAGCLATRTTVVEDALNDVANLKLETLLDASHVSVEPDVVDWMGGHGNMCDICGDVAVVWCGKGQEQEVTVDECDE